MGTQCQRKVLSQCVYYVLEDGGLSLGSFTPELVLHLGLQQTVPVLDVVGNFWLVEYMLYVDLMIRTHSHAAFVI